MSSEKWVTKLQSDKTRILCQDELRPCELSWSTVGEIMVRPTFSEMAFQETFDAYMHVDEIFGNDYKSLTRPFSMYGPFDDVHDVLFHDDTTKLRDKQYLSRVEKSIPSYDEVLKDVSVCMTGAASLLHVSSMWFSIISVSVLIFKFIIL